jgi:thiol-disulfide isomerase/thioredoxin
MLSATTGPDGVATFDWLPPWKNLLQFWPSGQEFARRRVIVEEGETGIVTTKVLREEAIRGRVVHADGSPPRVLTVRAVGSGSGQSLDRGQAFARTSGDGTYEMFVPPNEGYAVYVDDPDWAAPSRLDVIVREGKPVSNVDFTLSRGTILRGTVTVGPDHRPVANQFIRFSENGKQAPEDLRQPGDRRSHEIFRQFGSPTDRDGHYATRVGPGTYTIMGPPRTEYETITVKDEAEVVRDFHMTRPEKGPLAGQVTFEGKGVAGASVEIYPATRLGAPRTVMADDQGRFQAERSLDKCYLCARSPDGSLSAIATIDADDPEVTIVLAPTANDTGVLRGEDGKPAANQRLEWGLRIFLDEERQMSTFAFGPPVKTNADGHFTLPSLVIGQPYDFALLSDDGRYLAAGRVQPENAEPIDLRTVKAGAYHGPGPANQKEDFSSFDKDAPDAGHLAPPIEATTLDGKAITLQDFKGKYVLLDVWATWCGPCIKEIPQIQAVYDAFGKDERFVMLSLSVDEKVEDAKEFQEKKKLPWTQAFLGEGVHSPTLKSFGVRAIPAFVLVGPDGKIVARGMRGDGIKEAVAKALKTP